MLRNWFLAMILVCMTSTAVMGDGGDGVSLEVTVEAEDSHVEGPIPLAVKVTNEGNERVGVWAPNQIPELKAAGPEGWRPRKLPAVSVISGWLPVVWLEEGESFSQVVYLHDYFEEIKPGPATVGFEVSAARKSETHDGLDTVCVPKCSVKLNIAKADALALRARNEGCGGD